MFPLTGSTRELASGDHGKQHTLTGITAAKKIIFIHNNEKNESQYFDVPIVVCWSGCVLLFDLLKEFEIISVWIIGVVQVRGANNCVMALGVMFCKIIS